MAFLGLWRKKARPEEVGAYLTDYVVKPVAHYRENLDSWVDLGLDSSAVLKELFLLQTFSVDYAVSLVLRDAGNRKAVMETFWTYLPGQLKDEALGVLLGDVYQARREDYLRGITASPSNPTAGVGRAFASSCGSLDDDRIAEQAAVEFASTVTAITKFLMRIRVRPASGGWMS